MRRLYIGLILNFAVHIGYSQVGNFRSLGSGPWGTPGTWERDADSNGSFEESPSTVAPALASGTITILGGHTVTVDSDLTIDQLTVNSTGNLDVDPFFTLTIADGTGDDLTNNGNINLLDDFGFDGSFLVVNGRLRNAGTISFDPFLSFITFASSSSYEHAQNGGTIPTANWSSTSTLIVTGVTSTVPTNFSQSFGNFTWNCSGQSATIVLGATGGTTDVAGDFLVTSTSGRVLSLSSAAGVTVEVIGNLTISGNSRFALTSTGTVTLNVGLDFTLGGTGTGTFLATSGTGTLNLSGDLNLNSSTLSGNATSSINIVGSGTKTFASGSTLSGVNLVIQNGTTLDFQSSSFSGTGNFTLQAGATMRVGSPDGLVIGNTLGNIRNTGTRTYQANSSIVYAGGTQNLGSEWSSSGALNGVAVNLELAGGAVVTNNNIGSTSLVGVLTLTNGTLHIGNSNTLTIQGVFNSTVSGFIGGTTSSSLSFTGSGAMGTLNFAPAAQSLNNLTVGRSGTLILGTDLTVENSIVLSFGNLNISNRSLTFNGGSITSSGTGLISNNTSNITFGGSSFSGSVPFSGSGNQVNNLTFATPGGAFTLNSDLTVIGTMLLSSGAVTHGSGLTMSTGSTISRGGGTLTGIAPAATTNYNVTYTGTGTTGIELPAASSSLNNLNIQSSGTITLNKNITVNGNVNLTSGTLAASTFNIGLASTSGTWAKGGSGSFDAGTGTVTISGTYSLTGTNVNFGNLSINSGGSVTMPSGNTVITGNLQINAAATFNANNGTITLESNAVQTISSGGKTLRNLTVDKTGGSVSISSALSLTGILDIQTSTTVASNGNLTLVSNASGTATVASMAGGGSITGDVISQRYIAGTGRDYRDISAPVLNPTVAQIIASGITITGNFTGSSFPCAGCSTNGASFYFYDETVAGVQTLGYTAHPPNGGNSTTSTLAPGRGYNLLVRNEVGSPTMSLTGTLNSGTLSLPVSYTTTGGGTTEDGWNFVGNPYPSAVDWDVIAGWTKSNIQGNQISVWDPQKGASGGYRVWNGSTGDLGNGRIGLGQGFWIKASAAPTLQINESAKTSTATSFYRINENIESLEVVVKNLSSGSEDNTFLQLQEGSGFGMDKFDGFKKLNPIHNVTTLAEAGIPLSINAMSTLPQDQLIPLRLTDIEIGEFTININTVGDVFASTPVYLLDKEFLTEIDLTQTSYEFNIKEKDLTTVEDRFFLYFSEKARTGEKGVGINIYPVPVDDILNITITEPSIDSNLEILDNVGRATLKADLIESNGIRKGAIEVSTLPPGLYFVKGSQFGKPVVVKFLKRN